MAVTQADLDQLRHEFEAKLAGATIEHMNTATAIAAYGERFTAMDSQFAAVGARLGALDAKIESVEQRLDAKIDGLEQRLDVKIDGVEQRLDVKIDGVEQRLGSRIEKLDDKIDRRFNWQTVMFAALGFTTLFSDAIRSAIGL